jgi:hypothetical protein
LVIVTICGALVVLCGCVPGNVTLAGAASAVGKAGVISILGVVPVAMPIVADES